MAINDDKWFEVWHDDGVDVIPTHLLVVTPNPNKPSEILIIDPFENDKVVFKASCYEMATNWLREDDYSIANGRHLPDD